MKRIIKIDISLNNPSDRAVEEVMKALENLKDDIEYLLPSINLLISYVAEK